MAQDNEKKDERIAAFPALSRVLVIEASFRARQELLRELKSSGLFEEVIEAKSLADGQLQLEGRSFDACIIGSTISPERAGELIEAGRANAMSSDCAYVLKIAERAEEPPESVRAQFHAIMRVGISKSKFTASLITGIIRANKNTQWPGVKLDHEGNLLLYRDGTWELWDTPGGGAESAGDPVEALTDACADVLEDHSRSQVRHILQKLLSYNDKPESMPDDEFSRHFYAAVREWLTEIQFESEKVATRNLRARLLSFKPGARR